MVDQKDAQVIKKDQLPTTAIGKYIFLKDMGNNLKEDQAIKVKTDDAKSARIVQSRWRSYFKKRAHSRRETQENVLYVFLWLDPEKPVST